MQTSTHMNPSARWYVLCWPENIPAIYFNVDSSSKEFTWTRVPVEMISIDQKIFPKLVSCLITSGMAYVWQEYCLVRLYFAHFVQISSTNQSLNYHSYYFMGANTLRNIVSFFKTRGIMFAHIHILKLRLKNNKQGLTFGAQA